jgi:CIC family chloride channel protein
LRAVSFGAVGWVAPDALGGGHRLVEQTLAGQVMLPVLLGFFVLRFVLTMLSYGCGAPGGIFAPLLVLGSELGLGAGLLAQRVVPGIVDHPASFAVIGMAAYFSAIVRAPLTGIVLIVEMTSDYSFILPLLAACLTAYGVADFLGDRPVYEALLERDLLRGEERPTLTGTLLLELTVAPGAPFEGRRVRDLGLPPGCVLVTIKRGVHEHVPTAESELQVGDQVTAVVAPQAAGAVTLLRHGMSGGPN